MSRFRGGAIGLTLATVLGVANGIVVFGPAFKEQAKERETSQSQGKDDPIPTSSQPPTLTNAQAIDAKDSIPPAVEDQNHSSIASADAPSPNTARAGQPEIGPTGLNKPLGILGWLPWSLGPGKERENAPKSKDSST